MLRPLGPRDFVYATIIVILVSVTTYMTLRTRATYQNSTDIALLQQEVQLLKQARENDVTAMRIELNEIERTLYLNPQSKTPAETRRPSAVEQGVINSLKEFRDRITRIERQLYQLER